MAKKGKIVTTEPCVYSPPPYTAEEQETDYKRSYEFNKPVPARSPVSGWEDKYIREGERVPRKERALVNGNSHAFKGMRTRNGYGSRPTQSHRIGARKAK